MTENLQSLMDKSDNGRLIYAAILGEPFCLENPSSKRYANPCYDDSNKDLVVSWNEKSNRWNHYDFGDNSFSGDALHFVASAFNFDIKKEFKSGVLPKAFELLQDFEKNNADKPLKVLQKCGKKRRRKNHKAFKLKECEFSEEALQFWNKSGITSLTLKNYNVAQISGYSAENNDGEFYNGFVKKDELAFAYKIGKAAKIYYPFRSKSQKFRWIGNKPTSYIYGEYSEDNGDGTIPLVITGGEKDALTLIANGINAITFNSEVVNIDIHIRKMLYNSGYDVFSLLDDDKTGRTYTEKFKKEYSIQPIPLWAKLSRGQRRRTKDITDYVSNGYDIGSVEELIAELQQSKGTLSQSTIEKSCVGEAREADEANEAEKSPSEIEVSPLKNGLPPHFDSEIYNELPSILTELTDFFEDPNIKDTVLLSSITSIGSITDKVYGQYAEDICQPNIYFFIQGGPTCGKSALKWGRFLISQIDDKMYADSLATIKMYNSLPMKERKKKSCPTIKRLLFSADTSKAAMANLFNNNNGRGLMLEEEADTISSNMSTDWGDISTFLRKAWEGSPIEAARTSNPIPVKVKNAYLSFGVTGTPDQIKKLIPSHESGFFSRVCFYHLPTKVFWKAPNGKSRIDIDKLQPLPKKVYELWEHLSQLKNKIKFDLTDEQWDRFNTYFEKVHSDEYQNFGEHALQIIRRIGGTTFRISMALSIARMIDAKKPVRFLTCSDSDFNIAMKLADYFRYHNLYVMSTYPESNLELTGMDERYKSFFNALPSKFETADANEIADKMDIPRSTYQRMLSKFGALRLINRIKLGSYEKIQS